MAEREESPATRMRRMARRAEERDRAPEAEQSGPEERHGVDREVELETATIQPRADAPSRAGITGSGSGADSERG